MSGACSLALHSEEGTLDAEDLRGPQGECWGCRGLGGPRRSRDEGKRGRACTTPLSSTVPVRIVVVRIVVVPYPPVTLAYVLVVAIPRLPICVVGPLTATLMVTLALGGLASLFLGILVFPRPQIVLVVELKLDIVVELRLFADRKPSQRCEAACVLARHNDPAVGANHLHDGRARRVDGRGKISPLHGRSGKVEPLDEVVRNSLPHHLHHAIGGHRKQQEHHGGRGAQRGQHHPAPYGLGSWHHAISPFGTRRHARSR